jgi:hypothetical protein
MCADEREGDRQWLSRHAPATGHEDEGRRAEPARAHGERRRQRPGAPGRCSEKEKKREIGQHRALLSGSARYCALFLT